MFYFDQYIFKLEKLNRQYMIHFEPIKMSKNMYFQEKDSQDALSKNYELVAAAANLYLFLALVWLKRKFDSEMADVSRASR